MSEFLVDNAKLDLDPSVIAVLQRAFDKKDSAYQELETKYNTDSEESKSKIEALNKQLETSNGKIEVLETQLKERNDSAFSPEKIKDRVRLHKEALLHCDGLTEDQLYEMSDRQIKERIINLDGLESRSNEYIQGMYEATILKSQQRSDNFARQKELVSNIIPLENRQDSSPDIYDQIQQKYDDAWSWARGGK